MLVCGNLDNFFKVLNLNLCHLIYQDNTVSTPLKDSADSFLFNLPKKEVEVIFDFSGIDKSALKYRNDENQKKEGDVVDQFQLILRKKKLMVVRNFKRIIKQLVIIYYVKFLYKSVVRVSLVSNKKK
jgi:hypothetical protein